MNSRERLLRLFDKKEIDRVPIWLLFPYHRYGSYVDVYDIPCYRKVTDYIDIHCDTFDRRGYDTGFCYNANPDILRIQRTRREKETVFDERIVRYRDIEFTSFTARGPEGTRIKSMIEDASELERILEIPYFKPEPDLSAYFREKEELGDKGIMMLNLNDPLGPLYSIMSAEAFSLATVTQYKKLIEFTDEMYRRVLRFTEYVLENGLAEVFFIIGCEFAGPPLVSPEKFNEFSARYVKGIVDLIREFGRKSIVHYHGNLLEILEGIKYINPDGLHTIEAPPIGNCTIAKAREDLGDMVLIGNLQYDDLAHCEQGEIREMVRSAMEEGKSGRFILSPTAGPYEEYIDENMVNNYLTMIDAGIEFGKC